MSPSGKMYVDDVVTSGNNLQESDPFRSEFVDEKAGNPRSVSGRQIRLTSLSSCAG